MNLEETLISSQKIFDGKIVHLVKDDVTLPNGGTATREVIRHCGASAVLPVTENGEVVLERQFRYAVGQTLIEIPAGKLEPGEDPALAARRELLEETGYTCKNLEPLGPLYGIPAYSDECVHTYVATGLTPGARSLDPDEFLEVFTLPLETAVEWIVSGKITDSKTVSTVLKYYIKTEKEG